MTTTTLEALLKQNPYYCPQCLEKGHIRKLEISTDLSLVCVKGEHGTIDRSAAFLWEDLQNLVTVLIITKSDPEELQKIIKLTQEARASNELFNQHSPLLKS